MLATIFCKLVRMPAGFELRITHQHSSLVQRWKGCRRTGVGLPPENLCVLYREWSCITSLYSHSKRIYIDMKHNLKHNIQFRWNSVLSVGIGTILGSTYLFREKVIRIVVLAPLPVLQNLFSKFKRILSHKILVQGTCSMTKIKL